MTADLKRTFNNVIHYEFTWHLENIYMCSKLLDTTIDGPNFGGKVCSFPWFLKLGQPTNSKLKGISLFVHRINSPIDVVMNLRVLVCKHTNSKPLLDEKYRVTLSNGSYWESPILETNDEFRREATSNGMSRFWKIHVHLMWHEIVETELATRKYSSSALSQLRRHREVGTDLKRLFKSCKFSDIHVKSGSESIPAHKSILAARCPYLIEEDTDSYSGGGVDISLVPSSDPTVMATFLMYLYSGDVECMTENGPLPIEIHECAQHLDMSHLESLTSPYVFHGKSSVKLQTVTHESTIGNYSEIIKNNRQPLTIGSEPFGNPQQDVFTLLVTINPLQGNSSIISVFLKLEELKTEESIYVALDISARYSNNNATRKRVVDNLKQNRCMGFPEFLCLNEEENVDLLCLHFTCEIAYSRSELDTVVEKMPRNFSIAYEAEQLEDYSFTNVYRGWINMTTDLSFILLDEKHSDCTIVVGSDRLPAHRVILAARSSYFSTLFDTQEVNTGSSLGMEIFIEKDIEISTKLMKVILTEIYTGCSNVYGYRLAKDVYSSARFFGLHKLQSVCLETIECAW